MDKPIYHYDIFGKSDIHCRECRYVYDPYAFELCCTKLGRVVQDDGYCKYAEKRNNTKE